MNFLFISMIWIALSDVHFMQEERLRPRTILSAHLSAISNQQRTNRWRRLQMAFMAFPIKRIDQLYITVISGQIEHSI